MHKKFLVGLFLFTSFENQAVIVEDLGTVFSTVATVANNATDTTDLWRSWCGNMSDGPCIAATVLMGISCIVGGSCACCMAACGCGIGSLVFLSPCLIPTAKFCVQLPALSLDACAECCNDYVEQRNLRKAEQKNILLRLKQQHGLEFEKRRIELPKKRAVYMFANLKKFGSCDLKGYKTDMFFVFK